MTQAKLKFNSKKAFRSLAISTVFLVATSCNGFNNLPGNLPTDANPSGLLEPEQNEIMGGFSTEGTKPQSEVGNYLVSYGAGANLTQITDQLTKYGVKVKRNFTFVKTLEMEQTDTALLEKVKAIAGVNAVSPNYVVHISQQTDVVSGQGKPQPSPTPSVGQVVPAGVKRIGATPGTLAFTGSGVGVAILDTGIDQQHADLKVSTSCFNSLGTSCDDDNGHGTHVAGIAAALNNNQDVVGVAPGATLYAVKVLDRRGQGTDAAIIAGLEWVQANANTVTPAIKVVNLSLGRALAPGEDLTNSPLRQAIQALYNQNIAVAVSAGNEANREVSQNVPATYPEVFAIASSSATDGKDCNGIKIPADTASYFTTDGTYNNTTKIGVTISAPGEQQEDIVRNCRNVSSVGILSTKNGGGTTRMSGTSMSAPHVTGVLALMYEKAGGNLSPETARTTLRTNAERVGVAPLNSPTTGYTFDGEREGILFAPGML